MKVSFSDLFTPCADACLCLVSSCLVFLFRKFSAFVRALFMLTPEFDDYGDAEV